MNSELFNKTEYKLTSLVNLIERGELSLPDIQRPFVWSSAKVRDLFDSMYRGYPVGHLLLWENSRPSSRTIGTDKKQDPPRLMIIDGQQRLTSLYAVIKGVSVIRRNYKKSKIRIAFNPQNSQFSVSNAMTLKDKRFIPDISCIWKDDIFEVVDEYLSGLKESSEINDEKTKRIRTAIQKLYGIQNFSFTTLKLAENVPIEDVSDIFVRINSEGVQLKQADFILTLMSVFWDEGRMKLEDFCQHIKQSNEKNYFIEPAPDRLLRTSMNVAFKHSQLKNVYSILRSRNVETGQFSDESQGKQFSKLEKSQAVALNTQYWNEFISCIRTAGFRSKKMISSQNSLLLTYALYLIGRTEYEVDKSILRKAIAQWVFMSLITTRYTRAADSMMEADLSRLCSATEADQFIEKIHQACEIALPADFWNVTLPENLAVVIGNSPFLFAYDAALVLLNAPLLFSEDKLSERLDPTISSEPINRHHLFPSEYLRTLDISSIQEINQIANYAYSGGIKRTSRQAPAEYLPDTENPFNAEELAVMRKYHALPRNWEQMEYKEFLEKRRGQIAQIIYEGYKTLTVGTLLTPRKFS